MIATRDILQHLNAIGARIEPAGDRLLLRAGSKPVPASLIGRVRAAKPELLAMFHQRAAEALEATPPTARLAQIADGEPGFERPCATRRGRLLELDGAFLHFCVRCGRFAAFGYGVHLRTGKLGRWYCGQHRPRQVTRVSAFRDKRLDLLACSLFPDSAQEVPLIDVNVEQDR